MPRQEWRSIPQILAIVRVGRDGQVLLKKAVCSHLADDSEQLFLKIGDEVTLSGSRSEAPATW